MRSREDHALVPGNAPGLGFLYSKKTNGELVPVL